MKSLKTFFLSLLFIGIMSIPIGFCGIITIFSGAMAVPLNVGEIFFITVGGSGTLLLIFYSLIMLQYIVKWSDNGKLSNVEKTEFKKFVKTFLMTLLIYLLVSMAGGGIFYVTSILSVPILALALLIYSVVSEDIKKTIKTSFLHIGIASILCWGVLLK